ncbi:glycosyltransferase family 87 protein [Streptomyces sp. NPDC048606]|uniref:glycosyltransferase family 87 protein n=1 Tax=Streptomyces sp. NPDC048606 TaxID=3154726 RepID=UPI00341CDD7A
MTRSTDPLRSPSSLLGVPVTGALLLSGVLCLALRVPSAHAPVQALSAHGWWPPAIYPPFAAILFTPAAWLPAGILKVVLLLGNAGLLALLIVLSCRFGGLRARPVPVLAATTAGLWLEPLFQDPLPAQINLAFACLAVWDLGRARGALGEGFALGTAAGITLTPTVFIAYLLLTGRIRAGLTALAGFTGTALLGLLVLPQASADFWSRHLPETGAALLLDPCHLWVWAVPPLVTALAALSQRRRSGRPGGRARTVPVPSPRSALGEREAGPVEARAADRQSPASSSSASMIR